MQIYSNSYSSIFSFVIFPISIYDRNGEQNLQLGRRLQSICYVVLFYLVLLYCIQSSKYLCVRVFLFRPYLVIQVVTYWWFLSYGFLIQISFNYLLLCKSCLSCAYMPFKLTLNLYIVRLLFTCFYSTVIHVHIYAHVSIKCYAM